MLPRVLQDAKKFRPERWLVGKQLSDGGADDDSEAVPGAAWAQRPSEPSLSGNTGCASRASYLPFSIGPRACLGMSMAYLTLRTILMVRGRLDLDLSSPSVACLPGGCGVCWR